jgi:selenocysteine lyase/cysteine desulfurase
MEQLENSVDENTRVIAISHVQYASGFRADLERLGRIARKRDALLVVDTIQSLGVLPLNVEAELVDVAAGASHKWLLGPEGVGYLYLSDRARERLQPTLVGWTSVPNPEDYNNFDQGWNTGTLAWETGTGPTALIYGLNASLELLKATGTERIAAYLETLTDCLCENLSSKNYRVISARDLGQKSQIVCIQHRGGVSAMKLYAQLKSSNIITAPRADRLRIAPHYYNSVDEIDKLISALAQ